MTHCWKNVAVAVVVAVPVIVVQHAPILSAAEPVSFDQDIRPILSDACYTCHGPDSNKRATDTRFDQRDGLFAKVDGGHVVVPRQPDQSELIRRILSDDPDVRMPPPDASPQLSLNQKELLTRWIAEGAEYSNHWAFEPPQRPDLPTIKQSQWPRNAIDSFVLSRLEREGLSPSERATKETLIRRASLDLSGLPPTLEEIDAFLADDSPRAFETVVDRLLASPRFGEHFALQWLDAARYADSNGYQQDATRTMWPWRDWVIRAMNDNMPFDQFTIEQIAGDHLSNPTTDQLVATGFQRNHMLNGEGGRIAEESRVEYVMNRVETMGATWLGLTVGCGRCHDHKYDPFSQREFYQFYSYFNSVDERGNVDAGGNANPVLPVPTGQQLRQRAELADRLAMLNQDITKVLTPERQQVWEAQTLKELESGTRREYWERLVPLAAVSEEGQTVTIEEDGVVFVTGKNPATDNYNIDLTTDLSNITGLRLEALPHESFTQGGLARSDSGNFVLTELIVEAQAGGTAQSQRVKIASAQASFEQGGWAVTGAFDGNKATGWAVHNPSNPRIPRTAVFVFEPPITGGDGTKIRVRLEHQSPHPSHNLGRFRISMTTRPDPKLDAKSDVPEGLIDALKIASGERSDAQKKVIADSFRTMDEQVAAAQKRIDSVQTEIKQLEGQYPKTMIMRDMAQPRETYVLVRGVWDNPDRDQPIQPGAPAWLLPLPQDAPPNRLALAKWLVDRRNPLTARVVMNRYWQHFFGTGLVKTTEDFGTQGERPTHPKLLDWLAVEFMEQGWNVKHMLKLIVMSATYQQSAVVSEELAERDPYNELLARGARFRLTSQAIRDQALFLSGLLVEQIGGPPVKPYQPPGIWLDNSLGKIRYEQDHGDALYRRTLYTFWRRATAPTMLFDVATRQVCQVRPRRTNTPLHALVMLNDIAFTEASRRFAERVMKFGGESPEARLSTAFRMATSRPASDEEVATMSRVFNDVLAAFQSDSEAVAALLAVGESPRDASLNAAELAAYTTVMNMLLNLDETITRE